MFYLWRRLLGKRDDVPGCPSGLERSLRIHLTGLERVLPFSALGWQDRTVRFSYAESMTDPSFYLPLAQAAETAGFDSMVVPDSICYPEHAASTYPYSPDGTRELLTANPFLS